MMRKLLATAYCAFVALSPTPAFAQSILDRAQLATDINAYIKQCGTGCITGAILNTRLNNLAANMATLSDPNTFTGLQTFIAALTAVGGVSPALPPLHEGYPFGSFVQVNGNMQVGGDTVMLSSGDLSLLGEIIVVGSPTSGESVGVNWTVNGSVFPLRYIVQNGDTNLAIAQGLCGVITNNAALLVALAAYKGTDGHGHYPFESACLLQIQVKAGVPAIFLDVPHDPTGDVNGFELAAVSSVHTTIGVGSANGSATPQADGGPKWFLSRNWDASYVPAAGALGPFGIFQTCIGAACNQVASISTTYVGPSSVDMLFNDFVSGAANTALQLGGGAFSPASGCPGDKGVGSFSACYFIGNEVIVPTALIGASTTALTSGAPLIVHAFTNLNMTVGQFGGTDVLVSFLNDVGSASALVIWQASATFLQDGTTTFLQSDGSGNTTISKSLTLPALATGTATKYLCLTAGNVVVGQVAAC